MRKTLLVSLLINIGFVVWMVQARFRSPLTQIPLAVRNLEKIEFLRDFFDHYFDYQSSNFLAHQASVLPFFAEPLRDEKRGDIQKIQLKLSAEDVVQTHELEELVRVGENEYVGRHRIELTTPAAGLKKFFLRTRIQLATVSRETENPRGLQITELRVEPDVKTIAKAGLNLALSGSGAHLLEFPCVIQHLDGENTERLRIQVSGFQKTLIEISPEERWAGQSHLQATCDKLTFKLNFHADEKIENVYTRVSTESGLTPPRSAAGLTTARRSLPPPAGKPKPNLLKSILEQQLGFVIQPSKTSR